MALSKKHYVAIANELRDLEIPKTNKAKVAQALARVMRADNPRFDLDRFYSAVGADPREAKSRTKKAPVTS